MSNYTEDNLVVMCPECNTDSSAEAWNEATENIWGDDISTVEDILNGNTKEPPSEYFVVCPACGETSIRGDKIVSVD